MPGGKCRLGLPGAGMTDVRLGSCWATATRATSEKASLDHGLRRKYIHATLA